MKLRQIIYNSIGLGLGCIAGLIVIFNLMRMIRVHTVPSQHPFGYLAGLVIFAAITLFVGGGGFANAVADRLQPKPTMGMIVVYFLSIFLFPLGIWGLFELQRNRRKRHSRRDAMGRSSANHSSFTPKFLQIAANVSWISVVSGFAIAVLCGSTHNKSLIAAAVAIFALVVIFSFVLAITALWGVREHGPRGILIPALMGLCSSGLVIIFLIVGIAIGINSASKELKQERLKAIHDRANQETNAGSSPE
jgi:hypothetical protein